MRFFFSGGEGAEDTQWILVFLLFMVSGFLYWVEVGEYLAFTGWIVSNFGGCLSFSIVGWEGKLFVCSLSWLWLR